MTRNRASAKKAGTQLETEIATYLANILNNDTIMRPRLQGRNDKGDIAGVRAHGQHIVIECKNYGGQLNPSQWIKEAQTEADNDNALAGVIIAKRRGTTKPEEQYVLMTVQELVALITGRKETKHVEQQ